MKIIETKVFEFDELDGAAKERARNWLREANQGDTFWQEHIIDDDAPTIGKLLGITVDKIYYSGFSSQGDGACFEGSWSASEVRVAALKQHAPKDAELHRIADEFERIAKLYAGSSFTVKHRGHYYHENCTSFEVRIADGDDNEIYENPAQEEEAALIEAAKDFMRWIYKSLEKECDYVNSDEQIEESIKANEYTFTAEGKRFG